MGILQACRRTRINSTDGKGSTQGQQNELLKLRLLGEIEIDLFSTKQTRLRDREAEIGSLIEASGRQYSQCAKVALKAFELSQNLIDQWLAADIAKKSMILDWLCLNCRLVGVSLDPTMRKPFDLLIEGLFIQSNRGNWI
jgi:hypothetical protein